MQPIAEVQEDENFEESKITPSLASSQIMTLGNSQSLDRSQQSADRERTLDEKRQDIAVIYHNFMEIMTKMSSSVDRLRDTTVSSTKGFNASLKIILENFYKDDVLQPKTNPKLRLQEYYIKMLLKQLRIQDGPVLSAQLLLLDIIIGVNKLHLTKWIEKLEFLTWHRRILVEDFNRF